jgi:hypothetical protein
MVKSTPAIIFLPDTLGRRNIRQHTQQSHPTNRHIQSPRQFIQNRHTPRDIQLDIQPDIQQDIQLDIQPDIQQDIQLNIQHLGAMVKSTPAIIFLPDTLGRRNIRQHTQQSHPTNRHIRSQRQFIQNRHTPRVIQRDIQLDIQPDIQQDIQPDIQHVIQHDIQRDIQQDIPHENRIQQSPTFTSPTKHLPFTSLTRNHPMQPPDRLRIQPNRLTSLLRMAHSLRTKAPESRIQNI